MAFDISRFNAEATRTGFIRPAHFIAAIPLAPKWYGGDTRFLSYLCSGLNLPGTQILTSEERNMGYGPSRKVPYDVAHSDVTLTFYADGGGDTLAFFDNWLRNTVAFGNPSKMDPIAGAAMGEVQYPDHYESVLQLYVYNEAPGARPDDAVEIVKYTLDRAYPVSVSDITMDWSNGEAIATIQVTFTYRTFWLEKNVARKYGQIGGAHVQKDDSYLDVARGVGFFDNLNELARYATDYAQSINPGFVGLPFVDQLVGIASSVYSSINDKVTAVNGFASRVNSQLQSVGALASLGKSKSKPVNVPQVPTIQFP